MTDGNTYAINRHLAEREAYDEQRELLQELQDLRDEVDALAAKLKEAEEERDALRRGLHDETVSLGCMKSRAEAAEAKLAEVENTLALADDQRKEWEIYCKSAEAANLKSQFEAWNNGLDWGRRGGSHCDNPYQYSEDTAPPKEAALKTERRNALEEAMKVARKMNNGETAKAIAKAIRALIEEENDNGKS